MLHLVVAAGNQHVMLLFFLNLAFITFFNTNISTFREGNGRGEEGG